MTKHHACLCQLLTLLAAAVLFAGCAPAAPEPEKQTQSDQSSPIKALLGDESSEPDEHDAPAEGAVSEGNTADDDAADDGTETSDPKQDPSGAAETPEDPGGALANGQAGTGSPRQETDHVLLRQARTYRLEVGQVDSDVYVALARQWAFEDALPGQLLAAIKNHPDLNTDENDLFQDADGNPIEDAGYLRWLPETDAGNVGALLWFVNGQERKELVVSMDMLLDHSLGKDRPPETVKFGALQATIDLAQSRLNDVRWNDLSFDQAAAGAEVEDTVQVTATGLLTSKSAQAIHLADELLSSEITQTLASLPRVSFQNKSHHGITLGWMGYEDVHHGLILLDGIEGNAVEFRYTVSGSGFPLELVRRQLSDEGWPLALSGTEFVGTTTEGTDVYQPVDYLLSKTPDEPTPDEQPEAQPTDEPVVAPRPRADNQ